jgi:hypothetical protein
VLALQMLSKLTALVSLHSARGRPRPSPNLRPALCIDERLSGCIQALVAAGRAEHGLSRMREQFTSRREPAPSGLDAGAVHCPFLVHPSSYVRRQV